jgi:hypothetical protein
VRRAAVLLVLAGCHNRLPSAVSLPEETKAVEPLHLSTREDALRYVMAGDPLVRKPKLPPDEVLSTIPGGEALYLTASEIRRFEGPGHDLVGGLKLIGERRPGTETAVITRGYRLGLADRLLGTWASAPTDPALHDLAPLLSGLLRDEQATQRSHHALEVLADEGYPFPEAVRRYGDRWVLAAWLDGPDVPLGPVVDALAAPSYDLLRESRLGALIVARHARRAGDPAPGLSDLTRATGLALQKASSDRHQEQGAWSDVRRAAATELGADDPIGFLLDRALDRLTDAAADPEAAGGALVALSARRVVGGCDWKPCHGPDRVAALAVPGRYGPRSEALARAWRVVALKEALDTMDVAHDTVLFRRALLDLVDALIGTGSAPMPAGVLSRAGPEPEVWALLGAAVGEPTTGTWEACRIALGRHLASAAKSASDLADPSWRTWLDRIQRRAVP